MWLYPALVGIVWLFNKTGKVAKARGANSRVVDSVLRTGKYDEHGDEQLKKMMHPLWVFFWIGVGIAIFIFISGLLQGQ